MAELIRQFSTLTRSHDGTQYVARVYGEQRRDRVWIGWIEFAPLNDTPSLKAKPKVEQTSRAALVYWAAGLERGDLQSALEHANVR